MDNIFGKQLKELRTEKGYTQRTLAEKLGISPSAVGMYEQGRREPDNEMLSKLCYILETTNAPGWTVDWCLPIATLAVAIAVSAAIYGIKNNSKNR